jgi:SAM-dependent methyltransferase
MCAVTAGEEARLEGGLAGTAQVMHPTLCDLCGIAQAETLIESGERRFGMPGRFEVVRCRRCALVRTSPRPDDLGAYYPSSSYYSYAAPQPPTSAGRERIRRAYTGGSGPRRILDDRLTQGLPPGPPGRILDVGCGSGAFLLGLREAGWKTHGIEIDAQAVAAARAAGLHDVRAGELTTAGYPDGHFDAVRFWHSLEHVGSPRAQLAEARRVLRPGGTLTVGVPNFASSLSRRARGQWFYLDVPRHLWHFEPVTLRRVAEAAGFEVTRVAMCSTGDALLGTIDYLRGRGERLLGDRRAWYAALPAAALMDLLGRGDALWLEARRPPS